MSRRKRRLHNAAPENKTAGGGTPATAKPAAAPAVPRRSRRKVWLLRAALVLGAPIAFLLVTEIALRVVGYGQPAEFLLKQTVHDRPAWVANSRYGLRFFGPYYERRPAPLLFARDKPADAVRIFVFGESAAYGDPSIDFGLPRVLRAMLSLRYPDTKFEVINAAMTGINSHVVREIADDCAAADGDMWVVYMGNNEVVGPFGAGTVFGPQAPRAGLIRSSLAIKSTRFGQLLSAAEQGFNPPPETKRQWQGMLMFVDNQVREGDPRMTRVYDHFAANLRHILDAAEGAGARVVVSTVASNLRDCAPFASLHRSDLSEEQLEQWDQAFQRGIAAQKSGDHNGGLEHFRAAAEIDDSHAELAYALGRSLLAAADEAAAAEQFAKARDLDVLRFRCDDRLNQIVRETVADRPEAHVRLADAEREFARSASGAPGSELFYEHVHLTFAGNWLLARTLAEQIEPLLPARVRDDAGRRPWPDADQCARRLGRSAWSQAVALDDILSRMAFAPFTHQSSHAEQVAALRRQADEVGPLVIEQAKRAEDLFAEPLAASPDDAALYAQLCQLHSMAGNQSAASAAARRAVELLPTNIDNWMLLGGVLATGRQFAEAAEAYQHAVQIDDQNAFAYVSLGRIYRELDRPDDALAAFRQALAADPRYGSAYLELGQQLEADGKLTAAEENYQLAIKNRIQRPADLIPLADLCRKRNWNQAAAEIYQEAALLSPRDAPIHIAAGNCLVKLKQYAKARDEFAAAASIAPEFGEAHFLLAVELGRQQSYAAAVAHFREAARLLPQLIEPRINLALTLKRAGRNDEALSEFRRALDQDPANAVARQNIAALTNPNAN